MNTKSTLLSRFVGFFRSCWRADPVFSLDPDRARVELKNRIAHALDREAYAQALPSFELLERHEGFLDEAMNYRFILALDKGGKPPEARSRAERHVVRFGSDCLHGESLHALITGKNAASAIKGNTQEVMMALHIHAKALEKVARAMGVSVERLAEYGRRELNDKETLAISALRVDADVLRVRGMPEDDIAHAVEWFESLCRREPAPSVAHSAA